MVVVVVVVVVVVAAVGVGPLAETEVHGATCSILFRFQEQLENTV